MRSNQLSYPAIMFWNFVEIEGLEPSLTEPESVVLPLHHISIWLPFFELGLQRYECFVKMQNFFEKIEYFLEIPYLRCMKRLILAVIFALLTMVAAAQPRALGVRAGLEYQASYQHTLSERGHFLEVDLGYQLVSTTVNVACAYDFIIARPKWTQKGQWGVYVGPAVKAGFAGVGYCVSAGAQFGLEYTFEFPLQISIDTRPAVGIAVINRRASFYGGESSLGGVPCLSVRYRF